MQHEPDNVHSEPLPIRKLEENVINRIAAGEIVQRPASALKELIENSLDAGSTSIKVTVKDGGMKSLQLQDNGCGIRKLDLPILAERFTTSKISTFSDLSKLTTYGFRGEALASISYVSYMSVITKTKQDSCAWKACYKDGALVPSKEGTTVDPKACAGNDGTTITIENLFYNTPTRLSALRGSAEEYARILDVVTKYAIHNTHASFTCVKAGTASPDVTTPSGSSTTQAISQLYGSSIASDLLQVRVSSADTTSGNDNDTSWSADVCFTNSNYQGKKTVLLLFVNHRLVDSAHVKKALEAVYAGVLSKGTYPFVYLSLLVDPHSVDVNIHPTKREVHFLNEEAIIAGISDKVQALLVSQSQSRVFQYQTLLTGGISATTGSIGGKNREKRLREDREQEREDEALGSAQRKVLSQHKVRTSHKDRTLDAMFPVANSSQLSDNEPSTPEDPLPTTRSHKTTKIEESECYLTSVRGLRQALDKGKHQQLTEILKNHIFVGVVDMARSLSLIQHSTKLYLVNHGTLAEELFYQLGLRQFGNFRKIKLEPPPSINTLVSLAVEVEVGIQQVKADKSNIINKIVTLLTSHREMLAEYFSLSINNQGLLESIPLLLPNYTPNLDKLPLFLMRLGPQVNWNAEQECFNTFLRELAYFYVPEPLDPDAERHLSKETAMGEKTSAWQMRYTLFPALSRYFKAPKSLLDRDVAEVANLPDLYRVFERC